MKFLSSSKTNECIKKRDLCPFSDSVMVKIFTDIAMAECALGKARRDQSTRFGRAFPRQSRDRDFFETLPIRSRVNELREKRKDENKKPVTRPAMPGKRGERG